MNKERKIYTAADFANYHNGTMPSADMHALEKVALGDPFLADALEGYAATQTAESDVLALKKRLPIYENKASSFAGSRFIHSLWFRIAAILIVTLGVGYFYYNKYNDNEHTLAQNKTTGTDTLQMAETKIESVVSPPPTIATVKPPETTKVFKDKITTDPLLKLEDEKMMDEAKQYKVADAVKAAAPTTSENNIQTEQEKINLAATTNNAQNYTRYYTQQGNVTDLKGGPLQNVSVKDKNSNNGTVTDNNGRFTLKTTDSNAYVSLGTVGYQSKEVLLNNNSVQKITLNRKDDQLQEVVVTGMSAKRKKSEVNTNTDINIALQGKVPGVDIKPQQQTPPNKKLKGKNLSVTTSDTILNNTAAFNEYIKNTLIPLFDDNNKVIKGKVVLSFDIDKYGKPQNISVLTSSCTFCNSQAINLLQNSPAWLSNVLQSKKVVIEF